MTTYNPVFEACMDWDTLEIKPAELYEKSDNPELTGILLDEFEMQGDQPYYSGLTEPGEPFTPENKAAVYLALAEYMLERYENKGRRYGWDHAQQRKVLEKIIRLLDKAAGDKTLSDAINLARAKAHLYRSRLIRPKGFTVPAKKIEGLYKALERCLDSDGEWFRHYAGVIALELDRCGQPTENLFANDRPDCPPARLWDLLSRATSNEDLQKYDKKRKIEFYQMRVRLEEFKLNQPSPFKDLFFEDTHKFKPNELELERLKVAVYIGNIAEIKTATGNLINRLEKYPFAHPLWDDSVRFVRRLRKHGFDDWQNLALMMWKAAETKVIDTTSLQLRWYWSRQRNLYDMAFLAALEQNDVEKAAKIADSAKSKPALTWQALENLSRSEGHQELKDTLKKEIENNAKALSGVYIKGLRNNTPDTVKLRNDDDFPKIETESIVVQFYLVHLDEDTKDADATKKDNTKNGYALIYDKKKGGWLPDVYKFDFNSLFKKYINWQDTYFRLPDKGDSADELEALCKEMGNELDFLLNYPSEGENRRMVLIPHDFLHRVPLHGVLRKDGDEPEILLEKFRCSYLPALKYAKKANRNRKQANIVAFKYFDKKKDRFLNRFYDEETGKYFSQYVNFASKTDLTEFLETIQISPSILALISHGKADYINPFSSKLLFKTPLTFLEIATAECSFSGSDIFISACETDLTGPIDAPLDEHLSISSIFFNKHARAVLGTIYGIFPFWAQVHTLFKKVESNQLNAIYDIQNILWGEYKENASNDLKSKKLYHCLTYKYYYYC